MSSLVIPLNSKPTLSPASAWSSNFLNISTPVTTVDVLLPIPTISTVSPTLTIPRSTLPVATVPRPVIVNTSSTGIKKGLSTSLSGTGINVSNASTNSIIGAYAGSSSLPALAASKAFNAEPLMIGVSSPGNSYSDSKSLISISTNSSNSSSSTWSVLFINTTMCGTPT